MTQKISLQSLRCNATVRGFLPAITGLNASSDYPDRVGYFVQLRPMFTAGCCDAGAA